MRKVLCFTQHQWVKGGGEDAVKWNVLVSSVVFERCERAPFSRTSKQRFVGRELGVGSRWCGDALAFDGSFDSLKLSCRCPQQNFARPSVKDSRRQTATSPGRGHLLAGVPDSWAKCGLLCPVLCWIGLTPVLMTSSRTTKVRNDVIYTSSNYALR